MTRRNKYEMTDRELTGHYFWQIMRQIWLVLPLASLPAIAVYLILDPLLGFRWSMIIGILIDVIMVWLVVRRAE